MIEPLHVSGIGAVSTLAQDWGDTWKALLEGRYLSAPFAEAGFDLELDAPVGIAAREGRDLIGEFLSEGCAVRLAVQACREAIRSFGSSGELALYGGSTHGESDVLLSLVSAQLKDYQPNQEEALWRSLLYDSVAAQLGDRILSDSPPASWLYSSCTSSMHAVLSAALDLADGSAKADALVVGVDALSALGVGGFMRAGATTRTRCLPFDVKRDGTLVSEGAAAIILSRQASGTGHGVCLLGLGLSCDAGHPTQPDPGGEGLEMAVYSALNSAGLKPENISGLVLHGTGTKANDIVEATVCQRIFGPREVPATSIKGAVGHTLGAAGLFNCIVAIQSCRDGVLPPAYSGIPAISVPGIDLIKEQPRAIPSNGPVLVTCSGFGGNNVAAVFGSR